LNHPDNNFGTMSTMIIWRRINFSTIKASKSASKSTQNWRTKWRHKISSDCNAFRSTSVVEICLNSHARPQRSCLYSLRRDFTPFGWRRGREGSLALRANPMPNFEPQYFRNRKSWPYHVGTQIAQNFKGYRLVKVRKSTMPYKKVSGYGSGFGLRFLRDLIREGSLQSQEVSREG